MNKPRRTFLTQLSVIAGATALTRPFNAMATVAKSVSSLHASQSAVAVYHTNDLNGHINPVYKSMGGLGHIRSTLKNQETGGLLLDAGNFTRNSNKVENHRDVIGVMNSIGYHAAAIGANELSMGQEELMTLIPLMQFSLVNCNLQFDNKLADMIKPYVIIRSGNFKIGITGVCHKVEGIKYNDAAASAAKVARLLKLDEKCDLVVCLAQLGDGGNRKFAEQSEHIDMVIGGNDPKLCLNTQMLHNKLKHEIVLAQTAKNGLLFGRTIFNFDIEKNKNGVKAKHFIPGMPDDRESYATAFSALRLAKDLPV
jgi:5'-nucleotidase